MSDFQCINIQEATQWNRNNDLCRQWVFTKRIPDRTGCLYSAPNDVRVHETVIRCDAK